jgi:hypothetical protein
VSEDFLWEATLGYRKDPSVESLGTPADSSGIKEEPAAEPEKEKTKAEVKPFPVEEAVEPPNFVSQEINRAIRPQAIKPTGKPKGKSRKGLWAVATMASVALAAGGWFYSAGDQAQPQLKQIMGEGVETFTKLKDKVKGQIAEFKAGDAAADGNKPSAEEAMARLRERVDQIKAEKERAAKEQALALSKQKAAQEFAQRAEVAAPVAASPIVEAGIPVADSLEALPVVGEDAVSLDGAVAENPADTAGVETPQLEGQDLDGQEIVTREPAVTGTAPTAGEIPVMGEGIAEGIPVPVDGALDSGSDAASTSPQGPSVVIPEPAAVSPESAVTPEAPATATPATNVSDPAVESAAPSALPQGASTQAAQVAEITSANEPAIQGEPGDASALPTNAAVPSSADTVLEEDESL